MICSSIVLIKQLKSRYTWSWHCFWVDVKGWDLATLKHPSREGGGLLNSELGGGSKWIQLRTAIDSSNLGQVSRNRPRFQPCVDRLNVPSWLINQLGNNQPAGIHLQLLLAAAIAASNIYCLLPVGTAGPVRPFNLWLQERNCTVYGLPNSVAALYCLVEPQQGPWESQLVWSEKMQEFYWIPGLMRCS